MEELLIICPTVLRVLLVFTPVINFAFRVQGGESILLSHPQCIQEFLEQEVPSSRK